MNTFSNNRPAPEADRSGSSRTGEATLRLIATLPPPQGLEDRIKTGLHSSAESGSVLPWRGPLRPAGGWMYSSFARAFAAAVIVCAVAGGGWQMYTHVQPAPATGMTVPAATGNGFSNANAVRVPETLEGPVLKHPVKPVPEVNLVEKTPAQSAAVPVAKKNQPRPRPAPVQ